MSTITLHNVSADAVELRRFFDEQVYLGDFTYGEAAYRKTLNGAILYLQLEYTLRSAVVHVENKDDNNSFFTIRNVSAIRYKEHELHINTGDGNKLLISGRNNRISCIGTL